MPTDERQAGASEQIEMFLEPTPEMVAAGCAVPWVRSYQGEFEGFEPEHDAIMRDNIRELWMAMTRVITK